MIRNSFSIFGIPSPLQFYSSPKQARNHRAICFPTKNIFFYFKIFGIAMLMKLSIQMPAGYEKVQ